MSENPKDEVVAQPEEVEKIDTNANRRVWARFSKSTKPAFFKHLAEQYREELKDAGMSSAQIRQMENGSSPNNSHETDPWMVHHTTPRTVSGKLNDPNDFSNLVLIRKSSEQELHHYIDPQYKQLKPGESCQIMMVRPAGEFCALDAEETARQVQTSIKHPAPANSHAPENQGQGSHTHGNWTPRPRKSQGEAPESDSESEEQKPSRKSRKNRWETPDESEAEGEQKPRRRSRKSKQTEEEVAPEVAVEAKTSEEEPAEKPRRKRGGKGKGKSHSKKSHPHFEDSPAPDQGEHHSAKF